MALDVLAQAGVALVGAAILTFAIRRPRLAVEPSLRGTTRTGRLYVVAINRGGLAARRVRVHVSWLGETDERTLVASQDIGILPAGESVRLEIANLHGAAESDATRWRGLEVRLEAWNAVATKTTLPLGARPPASEPHSPVHYSGPDAPCTSAPDRQHRFSERRIRNDGVTEVWRLCELCRHVVREPLSDADQATQARIRRERAERERRKLEEEWARAEAERPRPRPRADREWRHHQSDGPARDTDLLPPAVAFYILELDPTTATWEDVAAAHRRLALAHHPDRRQTRDPEPLAAAERKMQEVNAARDRLREHFGMRAPLD